MNLPNYDNDYYVLDNGEEIHNETPDSFWIPDIKLRDDLKNNDIVKLIFRMVLKDKINEVVVERMWVQVQDKNNGIYTGTLDNDPSNHVYLKGKHTVHFKAEHVIDIYDDKNT